MLQIRDVVLKAEMGIYPFETNTEETDEEVRESKEYAARGITNRG